MLDLSNKTIIISRTDSIGDVCLTLPLCGYLKTHFNGIRIVFLGNTYTAPILNCCSHIDQVISWKELDQMPNHQQIETIKQLNASAIIHVFPRKEIARLAKKAGIPHRIGTSHRLFHLLTCNHRVDFTRKKADEHESQLNFQLLRPLGLKALPSIDKVNTYLSFSSTSTLPEWLLHELNNSSKSIILHPKSQGSAVEWGVPNFIRLAENLTKLGFKVFFTGTEKEAESFRSLLPHNCIDTSGKLTLDELIAFIQRVDYLVAASTGPLHIAGLSNKRAVGLFSPRRPIHPGRWKPLGDKSSTLVFDEHCSLCKAGKPCNCIEKISVDRVLSEITAIPDIS